MKSSTRTRGVRRIRKRKQSRRGRQVAKAEKVEHIIRNLDGTIGERNSYGNDPRNIKG